MARLEWNAAGLPYYPGVHSAVLYLPGQTPVAWNGVVSITEDNSSSNQPVYFEGRLVGLVQEGGDFSLKVSAFTYPNEFTNYTGFSSRLDKQVRKYFGMSYRTGDEKTGQIHLVYNAIAKPSDRNWKSNSSSAELSLFDWDFSTKTPVSGSFKPTPHLIIDLALTDPEIVKTLLDTLYGTPTTVPSLPQPTEVIQMYLGTSTFIVTDLGDGTYSIESNEESIESLGNGRIRITSETVFELTPTRYLIGTDNGPDDRILILDNGDGTWTASGPDSMVRSIDPTTFSINWDKATYITADEYLLPVYE